MPSHPFWILLPRLFFGQIPASTEPAKNGAGGHQGPRRAPPLFRDTASPVHRDQAVRSLILDGSVTLRKTSHVRGREWGHHPPRDNNTCYKSHPWTWACSSRKHTPVAI